jgi:hypothetical protein
MMSAFSASTPNPILRASYTLLFIGLAAGILVLPFSRRAALLPAAVIFGWSQLGGL